MLRFIKWAGKALAHPTEQDYGGKPGCEKGICTGSHDTGADGTYYVEWVEHDPLAVRVNTDLGEHRALITCATFDAKLVRKWLYASVTKYHCDANGFDVLIEQRGAERPSALPRTGLHLFTRAYVERTGDFREVLENEVSGYAQ